MAAKLPSGLTVQQEAFAHALARGVSQRQAYLEAGYKGGTDGAMDTEAHRIAKNPKVMARVQQLVERAAEQAERAAIIDRAWVLDGISKIRDEGLKIVATTNKNGEVVEKPVDLAAAARATELGAKIIGMMIERHQLDLSDDARKMLDRFVEVIATEVPDPAIRERIIARLSGDAPPHAPH